MTSPERYFIGHDNSGHRYLVPLSRAAEWRIWSEPDDDDEEGWTEPDYVTRLDGGLLTFTDPKVGA